MAYSLIRNIVKFAVLAVVLGLLVLAGSVIYNLATTGLSGGSLGGPFNEATAGLYLDMHADELKQAAGQDPTPVKFTVGLGDSARSIGERLQEAKLIRSSDLFRAYVVVNGLDKTIQAGDFMLAQTMTIPEIAGELGRAMSTDVTLLIKEGWRLEEIGETLSNTEDLSITLDSYMQLVGPGADFGDYAASFLQELAPGTSLEGFLFPDTYLLSPDATAQDVVVRMLDNFDQRVTADMRAGFQEHGLTLQQAVTLASIVEREAVIAEERPTIASVYYNRLSVGMKLDADPTVQYALASQPGATAWWPQLLLDDLQFDSPYNTYLNAGLPPGPIANPGLSSLQAVAQPAETDFMFFRAACDGSGQHNFSVTFEEHQAKACP